MIITTKILSKKKRANIFDFRRNLLSAVLTSSLSFGCSLSGYADSGKIELNIEAQRTDTALLKLAEESGVHIIFSPQIAKRSQSPSIRGSLTIKAALDQLLGGTKLVYEIRDDNVVVVNEKPVKESGISDKNTDRSRYEVFEEVIVTATKREESLQDVPISISALTTEDMERQGMEGYSDFARLIPGVDLKKASKNLSNNFTIRGIAASGTSTATQKTVAIYIDDVPITNVGIAEPDLRLYDIERVEVLRGPQGTLFGSGTLAGAVRIITKKADLSAFDLSTSVDFGITGSDSFRERYNAMINLPLVEDELALRLVGYFRDEEGHVDDIRRGRDNVDTNIDRGGRASLRWQANDRFSFVLGLIHQDSDAQDWSLFDPALGKHKLAAFMSSLFESRVTNYGVTLEYDLGWAMLTSSTNYSDTTEYVEADVSGVIGDAFDFAISAGSEGSALVEEVRLVSAGNSAFDWVLGGYFLDRGEDSRNTSFATLEFLRSKGITGLPGATISDTYSTLDIREMAGFGELSYHLTETLTLAGGLRYSVFKTESITHGDRGFTAPTFFTVALGDGGEVPLAPVEQASNSTGTINKLTKKISLTWQPNNSQTFYLLAADGFRIGQPNSRMNNGVSLIDPNDFVIPDFADSDELWNYEIGSKVLWLDDRLKTNLAIYYIIWSDIQLQARRFSDGAIFSTNAGEAVSKGIELEIQAWPNDALELGLSVTLSDAEITKLTPEEATISGGTEGSRLVSPEFQVAGYVQYTWALTGAQEVFARLDAQHVGSYPNGLPNIIGTKGTPNPLVADVDSYENVNVNLGWSAASWTIAFYGENVLDNDDFTFISTSAGVPGDARFASLRPRTFGVRLKRDF